MSTLLSRWVRWVRDWSITADVLRDPLAREILLGRSTADDYVEVERPAAERIE